MTLRYWHDDSGEVRCENPHGLMFTLPGPPPEWRPRVMATPFMGEAPARSGAPAGGRPLAAGRP